MTDIDNPKMLKKRVVVSVVSQIAGQLLVGFIGVVILKIMTNHLGTKLYGTYATIFAFVGTFALLTDLGVNTITTREIAKHPEDAAHIIGHNMGLRICLSLVMIPAIFGLSFVFYPHAPEALHIGILLMSLYLVFDVVWATAGGYFAAKVRNDVTARIIVLQQCLFLAGVCMVAFLGWKLFGYIAVYVTSVAIGAIVLLIQTRRHVSIRPRMNLKVWRAVMRTSIALGIISIINAIYLKIDSVMLSVISGPVAVGLYGIAYMLINIFSSLPAYVMGALTPSMATIAKKDLQQIIQKAFHFMVVFALVIVVWALLARQDAVLLVSNKEFLGAAAPFAILSLAIGFSYVSSVFRFASVAIDKHHKFVYLAVSTLLLNVLLNLLLIPRYGVVGAAWATVTTELCAMVIGYIMFHRQTGLALNPRILVKPIATSIFCLCIGFFASRQFHTSSPLINCTVIGLSVGLPYFAILYFSNGLPLEMKQAIKNIYLNLRMILPSRQ